MENAANAPLTFLVPNTQDPATLERLAGVPAGTYQSLKEAERNRPQAGPAIFEYWNQYRDTPIARLKDFLVFGYGPISETAQRTLAERGLPIKSGTTSDPQVKTLLLEGKTDPGLELTWFTPPLIAKRA